MSGLKEKIPFLGGGKKEDDEPPLSDQEMVTKFLRKSVFPIIVFITVILLGGLSGPVSLVFFTIPHVMVIVFAVSGLAAAEYKAVKGLFSNNRSSTLYDPSSQDRDDTEKRVKLNKKICNGIDDILKNKVKEIPEQISRGDGENRKHSTSEQIFHSGNENPATLKKPALEQPAQNNRQQTSKTS